MIQCLGGESLTCPLWKNHGIGRLLGGSSQDGHKWLMTMVTGKSPKTLGLLNTPFKWIQMAELHGLEIGVILLTLPETNKSHLKIDLWKRRFLLETTIFKCELLVSGRVHPLGAYLPSKAGPSFSWCPSSSSPSPRSHQNTWKFHLLLPSPWEPEVDWLVLKKWHGSIRFSLEKI